MNLAMIRKSAQMTQPEVARRLGVGQGVVGGCFQLTDPAARLAAGQLGQHLRVAFAADEVAHDVPAGHPVQVREH